MFLNIPKDGHGFGLYVCVRVPALVHPCVRACEVFFMAIYVLVHMRLRIYSLLPTV